MPFQQSQIFTCGEYHPYRISGKNNPKCDAESKLMMDFKDPTSGNHRKAVSHFTNLMLKKVQTLQYYNVPITKLSCVVTVVPSHTANRLSPALEEVAKAVCAHYPNWSYKQVLQRHTTVPSSHKDSGIRSVTTHLNSIAVVHNPSAHNTIVLILDDVKTSGSTLSACHQLVASASGSATVVVPFALLETTY